MKKFLVIVRHGSYGGNDHSPLSEMGRKQMQSIKKTIDDFVASAFGNEKAIRICFSFSGFPRAIQSIQELRHSGEDIVITNLYLTEREDIRNPRKILEKVMGVADYYGAAVTVIVAHGQMPAILAETAHEVVTQKKHPELPWVGEASGYIINLGTGEVIPIDSYPPKETKPLLPAEREKGRPVFKGGPTRTAVVRKGGPNDPDDDIPF